MQPIIIKRERTDAGYDNSAIEIQTPTTRIDDCGNEYIFWIKEIIRTSELQELKEKEVKSREEFLEKSNSEITKFSLIEEELEVSTPKVVDIKN